MADVRSTGSSRNPGEEPPKGGTTNGALPTAGGVLHASRGSSQADRACDRQKDGPANGESLLCGRAATYRFEKTPEQLFRDGRFDLKPPLTDSLPAGALPCSPLGRLGIIRQGIAENPAAVTRRAREADRQTLAGGRRGICHESGSGGPAGTQVDEARAAAAPTMTCAIWEGTSSRRTSLRLIYAMPRTCPEIDRFPAVRRHLKRFPADHGGAAGNAMRVAALAATPLAAGRDALEGGENPLDPNGGSAGVRSGTRPVYVPFSVNVFVPGPNPRTFELLRGTAQQPVFWRWFAPRETPRRRFGINGHILALAPICRINFRTAEERARHDRLVALADEMLTATRRLREAPAGEETAGCRERQARIDAEIDAVVEDLYSGIPSRGYNSIAYDGNGRDGGKCARSPARNGRTPGATGRLFGSRRQPSSGKRGDLDGVWGSARAGLGGAGRHTPATWWHLPHLNDVDDFIEDLRLFFPRARKSSRPGNRFPTIEFCTTKSPATARGS